MAMLEEYLQYLEQALREYNKNHAKLQEQLQKVGERCYSVTEISQVLAQEKCGYHTLRESQQALRRYLDATAPHAN